ncbi:MAG: CotH kinase family protein [Oscillospiraceae bacterium]|nr:CotH kinase family protein [Oscillospiraceae bacterium]
MKKFLSLLLAAAMSTVLLGAEMTVTAATIQPAKAEQVVNKTPATYKTLGVSKSDKNAFKTKVSKDVKLPIINITTKNNKTAVTSREKYVSCVVDVFNCAKSQTISEASAGVKVRGNSSAYNGEVKEILSNPVPYRIKFDSKTNMLGLNNGAKCKSWVLLKSDWDLIRNDIALRFGRAIIGDNAFCSDAQFVHLYVNDKFQGIYLLCEQSQVNKNRVNITEPKKGYKGTDIGYYLAIDNYATEKNENYVTVDYGKYKVKDIRGTSRAFVPAEYSIKSDVYSQEQADFIEKYINNLFEIVYKACEKGEYLTFDKNYDLVKSKYKNAKDTISAVMDVQSVVDMYLLYEIVHDYDCGEGSFYMCIDFAKDSKCPKLQFTSPWDFNWAYYDSTNRYWAAAFSEKSFVQEYGDRSNPWFIVLMKQDWFADMAKQKWTKLYNAGAIQGCIDEEVAILEEYKKDLNKTDANATDCSYYLLEWINDRIKWMNKTFVTKKKG